MNIVFMGTPGFAVQSLLKLVESRHQVVGVVTVPDKPQGRGQKLGVSDVKKQAEALGLPVLQPESLKDPAFLDSLKQWKADCFAVVAFRILPAEVFEMPPLGTVNLHASLLPKYRGAAPIQWALMNGDSVSGVTTFFIQKKVDTGDILFQKEVDIADWMNAGDLHDALSVAGAELLVQTMDAIETGSVQTNRQEGDVTQAPKILPEHCLIDWNRSAKAIRNQIRALSPMPGAFTQLRDQRLKIYRAIVSDIADKNCKPGQLVVKEKDTLIVATGDGSIGLEEVQIQGKKKMEIGDFLRGFPLQPHDHLGE